MAGFDSRAFRDALGSFATGVAIITSETAQGRIGATVSSFNSVSLDPPLILFSLARSAFGITHWRAAAHYGVVILPDDQSDMSNKFARSGGDKWSDLPVQRMNNGSPLLPDWLAYFECEPYANYDGGDHDIFVCRVSRFETRKGAEGPLVFFRGRYAALDRGSSVPTSPEIDFALHGW
ncbi:flavin reductase family protein [Bradyrhizobium sp. 190]|uniref:flavin reductase family protein n=1 Tax=Bradyrhizobium sp. 190 TaxID=2782658 RepID=UPI001FF745BD|nr:flavin reductase family protein [Bradyrhizobium sp. 190]MCK1513164.1 flavin reductase family protein [Bradyrhizobium sp. 190]